MDKLAELENKLNSCSEALMVLVAMLHRDGAASGAGVASAWSRRAVELGRMQPDTAHFLGALSATLGRAALRWGDGSPQGVCSSEKPH